MNLSGSNDHRLPSPLQTSQAPNGLLKLKLRGSGSGTLAPHSGQARLFEYSRSSPLTTATVTSPPASFIAVSILASRRFSIPGFTSNRSTTISIV